MNKRQARPYTAPSPAAKPASLANAKASPRPLKHDPPALPLFAMYFLGAWAGKPGVVRGRK
ncbi:hypothetical protein PMI15_04643 [Polaromonas sp. CF318]|uniref:hypothetical protein n=1 Tax=Polaromonas sp. CF318 TaxID=1144318 RepID=UPI0002713D9E|nr:hypothetical protein [Polaromonas sp. CF318]EJL77554.1 hypothetical protein PMI15_04643 [Polaromonas sp. CF318]